MKPGGISDSARPLQDRSAGLPLLLEPGDLVSDLSLVHRPCPSCPVCPPGSGWVALAQATPALAAVQIISGLTPGLVRATLVDPDLCAGTRISNTASNRKAP